MEGYDSIDASAAVQVCYTVLVFLSSARYLISPCGKQALAFLLSRPAIYLLLYVLICMFSFLWSEKRLYSAFMGFQCLAFLMLLTIILDRLRSNCSVQDMVEWMMFWIVWQVFWRITWRVMHDRMYYTIFASERLQTGILFFLAIYISRRRLLNGIVMAFALFSGSNKMYLGLLLGGLLGVFSENWKVKVLSCVGAVALISGLFCFGWEPVLQETVWHGRAGVGMEYTSGRNTMWAQSLDLILQKPFLGYGFVSGERDRIFVGGINTISVHNMMLSAALGVGIIGPLLLSLYFLETTLLCFRRNLPRDWLLSFLATIGMSFLFSMTEPGLGGRVYGAWEPTVLVMTAIGMICRSPRVVHDTLVDFDHVEMVGLGTLGVHHRC
jgi:O-antigen ligase